MRRDDQEMEIAAPVRREPPAAGPRRATDGDLLQRIADGDDRAFDTLYRRFPDLSTGSRSGCSATAAAPRKPSRRPSRRSGAPPAATGPTAARVHPGSTPSRETPSSTAPACAAMRRSPTRPRSSPRRRARTSRCSPAISWRVHRAVRTSRENEREVLELAYWGGLSQSEVAHFLDVPLGTVKTRTRSGLARLADLLEGEFRCPTSTSSSVRTSTPEEARAAAARARHAGRGRPRRPSFRPRSPTRRAEARAEVDAVLQPPAQRDASVARGGAGGAAFGVGYLTGGNDSGDSFAAEAHPRDARHASAPSRRERLDRARQDGTTPATGRCSSRVEPRKLPREATTRSGSREGTRGRAVRLVPRPRRRATTEVRFTVATSASDFDGWVVTEQKRGDRRPGPVAEDLTTKSS